MTVENTVHAKVIELGKEAFRMTTASGSGHPSSAISLGHVVVELMYRQMRHDPKDPWNPNNDRLVLSEGHAVPIVYAAWADLGGMVGGYPEVAVQLDKAALSTLREQDSVLDGHPNPAEGFPFFDAATGSLGQGLSAAAGIALAARLDGINKRVFALIGDGEAREGQVWEAADFIVDHGLTNICAVFSCNGHGQAAAVSEQQSAEVLAKKLAAFGWEVVDVDGHDPAQLADAFSKMGTLDKPLAVVARTVKGWGVDSIIGKNFHGKPIAEEQLDGILKELDATGEKLKASASEKLAHAQPAAGEPFDRSAADVELPSFKDACARVGLSEAFEKGELATRVAYGVGLVALGDVSDRVVCLDADVSNSTFANFFAQKHPERFFECKIAEQNMVTAGVGLSAGGKIAFVNSFAKFLSRATDQIDMACISRANIKIVGSHAGVSLAADGPSQMSMSDMAYFRSMTGVGTGNGGTACIVFHPSDPVCAYRCCGLMAGTTDMCFMRTHRPNVPFLYSPDERFELGGCKQLRKGKNLTIASSGYMVHSAIAAASRLASEGVSCSVYDCYTFPLDPVAILSEARSTGGKILTIEDNFKGGLHAELAEAASYAGDVSVTGMTLTQLPKSARLPEEVFAHTGVGLEDIISRAKQLAL